MIKMPDPIDKRTVNWRNETIKGNVGMSGGLASVLFAIAGFGYLLLASDPEMAQTMYMTASICAMVGLFFSFYCRFERTLPQQSIGIIGSLLGLTASTVAPLILF